ncbi:LysE family translocator [Paraburkholderia sp. DHOC27]|uniref:LysE family translocator n=1 Tax=Paraburkholderia sp. DHOC27 TaxID=2303330 RepID=UPI000E3B949F|nr:LysE family translocator [Paraburkholderia sp. DHOC27]RFU46491.1 LysE family translocator [Paraburkholderia sp. DHOC27]
MLPVSTLLPFFGVSLVLGLAPGPDNVFVLLQSAMRGPRAGMVIVLGLCTGLLVHTFVVAVGLGALLVASKLAFTVLKSVGAVYLVYLAWQAWRAPVGIKAEGVERIETGHLYRRGVIMNLSNPKVVIFFLAFLPQFVIADRGHVALQITTLGLVFIVASLIVFSLIAYFSGTGGKVLLRSERTQRALNRFASIVFVGLAAKLASAHL